MRLSPLFVVFLFVADLSAQSYEDRVNPEVVPGDTSQRHQVILRDYTRLRGLVTEIREDSFFLVVATVPDTLALPTAALRHLGLYRPERWEESGPRRRSGEISDLNDLTYLRTALPFAARKHIKSVMLVYNAIDWTLNDHWQLGTGLAGPLGVLFTQRYRTSLTPYLHVGLSNETLFVPLGDVTNGGFPAVGDLTTLLTLGNPSQFMTTGFGLFYSGGEQSGSVYNYRVGAGLRVSRRVHLYGEMLGFYDSNNTFTLLPSLNIAVAKNRNRWSYGLMSVLVDPDSFIPFPIPYISYTYSE